MKKVIKQLRTLLVCGLVSSTFMSSAAFAAAFQLYELGTPIIGTAGVGQAVINDASAAYFNPASMTQLSDSQLMLGSQLLIPYMNFSRYSNNTIPGNNGGNAGSLVPGMDLYFSYSATPELKFGVSLTSPFGGAMTFNDGWIGRYYLQNVMFYSINLNPSVAYRVTDWVSLGAGFVLEYMNLQETIALPIPSSPPIDAQVKISAANTAPGFNLGAFFTPYQSTKIGVAYRSQIVHHLSGNTTFLRIAATPTTSTKLVDPAEVIISLSQGVSNSFTLLAEAGWANWSTMRDSILTVDGYSVAVPQNWSSTYRFGLGGRYNATRNLLLQLGASYDSSPTTSSKRLPDLPMDRQIRIGGGVIYRVIQAVSLGLSYEYINFGRAVINNTTKLGVIAGSYSRNYADVLQVSLNVDL